MTLQRPVQPGRGSDHGRGILRLDPDDLKALGLDLGDLVSVQGSRATVARALPTIGAQRGQGAVFLDESTHVNAGSAEAVKLAKLPTRVASRVVLTPLDRAPADRDLPWLGRRLDDVPVVTGDRLSAQLFGNRTASFVVERTQPDGPVLIGADTRLIVGDARPDGRAPPSPRAPTQGWDRIGGLGDQLRLVRELVELPLQHPEVFTRLGVRPPKGVLLHGPPGCGKTLIARTIASAVNARFFTVNGPEIIRKHYGESEAQLRKVFNEAAKQAPAVLFLDEVDALAPARDRVQGEVEKRVVATLLALMDGLDERGQLVVIAATNLPDSLDPALRRPGRFDREIAIPVPDQRGRREILDVHTAPMPLAEDVDLDELAGRTHGYVGADLAALCREAAMHGVRECMDTHPGQVPLGALNALRVERADFLGALDVIQPSAVRENFVEVPQVRWDEVAGLDAVRDALLQAVSWPLEHPELFEQARLSPPRGILLHGPPGCGKTLMARAVASSSGVNFLPVKGPELLSRYVGDSEKAVRDLFKKARQAAPCVLFFDEVDGLLPARSTGAADDRVGERVLTAFLAELDGVQPLRGVLVLGATNRLDRIDAAALRPGRFDALIEVPRPDETARRAILGVHLDGRPLADDVDLDSLARRAEGAAGADLMGLTRRAALVAVARSVGGSELRIGMADLEQALQEAREQWEVR